MPSCKSVLCALALAHAAGAVAADAPPYPTRPIRFIVPVATGGGTDMVARVVAQKVGDRFGQALVIDNRAGAGGVVGVDIAAKAVPDGYTILMGYFAPIGVNVSLSKVPYDPVRDFAAVTLLATSQNLLAVHPSVPATSVRELIALLRAKPAQYSYSSGGNGSAMHVSAELFNQMAGVKLVHIPYKGAGPALIDLVAGQVQVSFVSVPTSLAQVRAGRVRALAVAGNRRAAALPDVPTVDEAGLPGFESSQWYGVMVPRQVAPAIITRLHSAFTEALAAPDVKSRLLEAGFDIVGNTPAEFDRFIRAEIDKWAKVIRTAGIRAQ